MSINFLLLLYKELNHSMNHNNIWRSLLIVLFILYKLYTIIIKGNCGLIRCINEVNITLFLINNHWSFWNCNILKVFVNFWHLLFCDKFDGCLDSYCFVNLWLIQLYFCLKFINFIGSFFLKNHVYFINKYQL
jgi:hypothetical protein